MRTIDKEPKWNIGNICKIHSTTRLKVWQKNNRKTVIKATDVVKVGFPTDDGAVEWMWVLVTLVSSSGMMHGILDNDPVKIKSLKNGDKVTIQRGDICDLISKKVVAKDKKRATVKGFVIYD